MAFKLRLVKVVHKEWLQHESSILNTQFCKTLKNWNSCCTALSRLRTRTLWCLRSYTPATPSKDLKEQNLWDMYNLILPSKTRDASNDAERHQLLLSYADRNFANVLSFSCQTPKYLRGAQVFRDRSVGLGSTDLSEYFSLLYNEIRVKILLGDLLFQFKRQKKGVQMCKDLLLFELPRLLSNKTSQITRR